jgi:hypothetical protein
VLFPAYGSGSQPKEDASMQGPVMPKVRAGGRLALAGLRSRGLARPVTLRPRARWSVAQAREWGERTGWLLGCNFCPSSAGNQLELWQEATFDPDTIDRELGWAAEAVGMNSIRLFLHDLAWEVDPDGFLDRVDRVLGLAAGHGISVMPVLFDGIWDPDPRPGPQRAPVPGVHNSTWLQGPGAAVLGDRSRWPALRRYVDAVLGRFGDDDRVVAWDLFNEPDNPNPAWAHRDPRAKADLVADLLEQVWDWAVDADPTQPLTVGLYQFPRWHPERAGRVARIALERSDVLSFHCYEDREGLVAVIDRLERHGRPLLCTEWMGRPASPVALAEVLRERNVGAYTWGLVDGRTQTRYSWVSWVRPDKADRVWFHDLLHPDGRPYDRREAALLRGLSPRPTAGSPPDPDASPGA